MNFLKRICLFIFLIAGFLSCKKEYSAIGLDMEGEMLGTDRDTTTIKAYSVLVDSLYTTNLTNQLLGYMSDPIFGKTQATIYSQFVLSGASFNFGNNPTLDSIVLTLQISGSYGDTLAGLTLGVYELTEGLSTGTSYYQYSTTSHTENNLVKNPNRYYYVRPNSPVILDTATLSPHLRVRLSDEFGQRFIDNASQWTTDDILLENFKGLCIKALTYQGNGCLIYSNMVSSLTTLTIYYHNDLDNGLSYSLMPSSDRTRYTNINHFGYADACSELRNQILDHDTMTTPEHLYLQATCGVKTKVSFPYIHKKFAGLNNKVVINRAELVISNVFPDEVHYLHPSNLTIEGVFKDGRTTYIPDDDNVSGNGFFGGNYDVVNREYRIRITRYIELLLLNNSNYADYFYLQVKGAGIRANRLVFNGSNGGILENRELKVILDYTTY